MIETILIHDPKTKTGSAAISVSVGSNDNPRDIEGLAHLLEHMLFLGSSKYPDNTEMGKLIDLGGGFENAYTSQEETNYFFVSGNREFVKALDIFSWFFKDPILDSKSIEKEVQNVNSEHRKNLNDDDWKAMNLIKNEADDDQAYHDFSTGNVDTLWEIPKNRSLDMSKALKTFYNEHYSANLMKLVIVGNYTLEELEEIAIKKFVDIPNKFHRRPVCKFPFQKTNLPLQISFLPTKQKHVMTLVFPIDIDVLKYHTSSPLKYVAMLLSYGGKGSLEQILKNEGYIHSVNSFYMSFDCWSEFEVEFALTDKGIDNYEKVVNKLFHWIGYIKTIYSSQGVWNIMQKVSEYDFYYMHTMPSTGDSSQFASNMNKFPFKYVYSGDEMFFDKDDKVSRMVLDRLSLNNTIIVLSSPRMETKGDKLYTNFDQTDEFYGTKYSVKQLSREEKMRMKDKFQSVGKILILL
jgi:insulysin